MQNQEILELTTSAWREKVYIETTEHIIMGYIFMPKIGKRNRILSEVFNSNKNFFAVKNCTVEYKLYTSRSIEQHDFMQVKISSILIMRPLYED